MKQKNWKGIIYYNNFYIFFIRRRSDDEDDIARQVRRKIGICDSCDFTSVVDPSISKPQSLDIIVHPDAKRQELLNNYKDVVQNMVFNNLTKQNTLKSIPVIPYSVYKSDDEDEDDEQVSYDFFLFLCSFVFYYALLLVFHSYFNIIEWLAQYWISFSSYNLAFNSWISS